MDYGFIHEGRVFTPNATPAIAPDARNAEIEQLELAQWAEQPERFHCYVDRSNLVTTWRGKPLGKIVSEGMDDAQCDRAANELETYYRIHIQECNDQPE
jgi:hypothetical protein